MASVALYFFTVMGEFCAVNPNLLSISFENAPK